MRPRTMLTRAAVIAAAAAVFGAAPAAASSIVYIGPDGNVWLTSPTAQPATA